MKDYITIIGGGLAGCEAAFQIAKRAVQRSAVLSYHRAPAQDPARDLGRS